jgi:hypothetical protein
MRLETSGGGQDRHEPPISGKQDKLARKNKHQRQGRQSCKKKKQSAAEKTSLRKKITS